MNGRQFDAQRKLDTARAQVGLKQHELRMAKRALRRAQRELREAIAADKPSWEAGH